MDQLDTMREALRAAIKAAGAVALPGTPDEDLILAWQHVAALREECVSLRQDAERHAAQFRRLQEDLAALRGDRDMLVAIQVILRQRLGGEVSP